MSDVRRSSDNRAVWIVLAVIGGVVLVVALVCGGLAYLFVTSVRTGMQTMHSAMQDMQRVAEEMQNSRQAAQRFIEDLREQRFEDAYEATTDTFQRRQTRPAFEAYVRRYEAFNPRLSGEPPPTIELQPDAGFPGTRDSYDYRFRVGTTGRFEEFRVTVVKVNNEWLVDRFVGPEALPATRPTTAETRPDQPSTRPLTPEKGEPATAPARPPTAPAIGTRPARGSE